MVRGSKTTSRSSWTSRGSEGGPVAMRARKGSDGAARPVREREPGEVKPRVEQVKLAGDSTPARPDTAARLENLPPATKSTAEPIYE